MKFEMKTLIHHALNEDGSTRTDHCCGCWNIILDEDDPLGPYAQCNECGEIRKATYPGVLDA